MVQAPFLEDSKMSAETLIGDQVKQTDRLEALEVTQKVEGGWVSLNVQDLMIKGLEI